MLKNKYTILVVGGAGYIGSHTVKLLRASNYNFVVFDNLSTGHAHSVESEQLMVNDLSDTASLESCFEKYQIDIVMHFASSIAVGESVVDPAKYYRNNVVNTINLLDAMRKHKVSRIIFSSTAAVYGDPIETPISVNHPRNPVNPYGKSKSMVEQIIEDYHRAYGLQYVFLRYFNAAGAHPSGTIGECHDPETHLIPLALQVAAGKRRKLKIFGNDYETKDGTCIRDYVHVCDIAKAHILAMDYLFREKKSHCINVGTAVGNSVAEVVDIVEKITKRKLNIDVCDRRAGDPPVLVADAHEAKTILNWTPDYPKLEDIIQHAWNFEKTRA